MLLAQELLLLQWAIKFILIQLLLQMMLDGHYGYKPEKQTVLLFSRMVLEHIWKLEVKFLLPMCLLVLRAKIILAPIQIILLLQLNKNIK